MTLRIPVVALATCLIASTIAGTGAASASPQGADTAGPASAEEAAKINFGEPSFFRMKRPGGLQGSGDFDQDGNSDLVSLGTEEDSEPYGRGYITVYAGDGAGDFKRAATATPEGAPGVVRVGDMNDDGDPDLVITSNYHVRSLHTISVYLGRPGLEFAEPITKKIRARVLDFELGDLDDDGDLDVAMNSESVETRELTPAAIALMENLGDGRLGKRPDLPYNTQAVELGDIDEDGRLDIAADKLGDGGSVVIVLNEGAWSFTQPQTFTFMGEHPYHLRLRDLDADGHLDLTGAADDGTNIRYGLGDGTFGARTVDPTRGFDEATDIDGDGLLDLVFDGNGSAKVAVGQTGRTFASPVTVVTVPGEFLSTITDVDGDGLPDFLLTTTTPHRGAVMLNTSTD